MKKLLLGAFLSVNLLTLAMGEEGEDRRWFWENTNSATPPVLYADNNGIHRSAPLPATSTPAGVAAAAADLLADNQRGENRDDDGEGLSDAELATCAHARVQGRLQALQAVMAQVAQGGAMQDGYARFLGENFDRLVDAEDDQIVDELWPDARQVFRGMVGQMLDTVDLRTIAQVDRDISDEEWAAAEPHISQMKKVNQITMQKQVTGELGKAGFQMQCIFLRKIWAARKAKQQAGAGGAAGIYSTT